jgi:diguanylate cyclase (GGDEF)-like protein/PAS domain S-box-containing protein
VPVEVEAHAETGGHPGSADRGLLDHLPIGDGSSLGSAEVLAFNELADAAHDAFVAFDSSGLIRSWNTAAARLFGYRTEEALGQPTTMLVPEAQAAAQQARIARALDGERINGVTAQGRRRDGTLAPLKMTLLPAQGRGGCVIVRDLTEEHLAQVTLSEAEFRLREAQELSHVGLWLWDAASDSLQISDELYRIHGISPLEFDGTMAAYMTYTHPDDRDTLAAAMAKSLRSGEGYEQEYRIAKPDGTIGWIYSRAQVVTAPGGASAGLRGVAQDVTDRKRAAESLRDQAALLELLRQMAVAANEATDLEQALRVCVRDVCLHTGWPVGEVVFIDSGHAPASWNVHTADAERFGQVVETSQSAAPEMSGPMASALQTGRPLVASTGGPDADATSRAALVSGLDTVVVLPLIVGREVVAVLRFFGRGQPDERLVITVWDGANQLGRVVERARSRDELSHQALHDSLTGLPNRTLLMDRLGRALAHQARARHQVALVFLDLDNFKLINDSLGHEAGDELVIEVARRLDKILRPEDTAARLGGDEFIVLCDQLEKEEDAVNVAERILVAVSEPISLRGHPETVITASAGIAIASAPGITPEALLRDADLAMYRAKEAGRGRYQIFDSAMHRRANERLTVANELRSAISDGQFRLLFQPQVDTMTGEMLGVEALIRWQHPTRGLIGPLDFIPVAEESYLIIPLGDWVLTEACRQGARWQDEYPQRKPLKLCVNVSAKQLARAELVADVACALKESGLAPSSLCIEITESVLMSDVELFLQTLVGLKVLGVAIAIDDFGTGYSSLAYLRRYPIDVIKVDKAFVDGLEDSDPKPTAVVAAVINLAHALGVVALAEGVETEAQHGALERLGCDQCQGYYFGKPAPPEVISQLLMSSGRLTTVSVQ